MADDDISHLEARINPVDSSVVWQGPGHVTASQAIAILRREIQRIPDLEAQFQALQDDIEEVRAQLDAAVVLRDAAEDAYTNGISIDQATHTIRINRRPQTTTTITIESEAAIPEFDREEARIDDCIRLQRSLFLNEVRNFPVDVRTRLAPYAYHDNPGVYPAVNLSEYRRAYPRAIVPERDFLRAVYNCIVLVVELPQAVIDLFPETVERIFGTRSQVDFWTMTDWWMRRGNSQWRPPSRRPPQDVEQPAPIPQPVPTSPTARSQGTPRTPLPPLAPDLARHFDAPPGYNPLESPSPPPTPAPLPGLPPAPAPASLPAALPTGPAAAVQTPAQPAPTLARPRPALPAASDPMVVITNLPAPGPPATRQFQKMVSTIWTSINNGHHGVVSRIYNPERDPDQAELYEYVKWAHFLCEHSQALVQAALSITDIHTAQAVNRAGQPATVDGALWATKAPAVFGLLRTLVAHVYANDRQHYQTCALAVHEHSTRTRRQRTSTGSVVGSI